MSDKFWVVQKTERHLLCVNDFELMVWNRNDYPNWGWQVCDNDRIVREGVHYTLEEAKREALQKLEEYKKVRFDTTKM